MTSIRKPTFTDIYLNLADQLSQRSECDRLQVGCVITSEDGRYVYGVGYNGGAAGIAHKCTSEPGNCGCLHAEINAVINCKEPRSTPKIVYCTHNPCAMCSKAIVNMGGVIRVIFERQYRDVSGIDILVQSGIQIMCTNENSMP